MHSSLSNTEVLTAIRSAVSRERALTAEVIAYLQEIEKRRIYAELGYSSTFEFCVKELGYSKASAFRRISAVRLARDLPEVKDKIRTGELTLCSATTLHQFFRKEESGAATKITQKEKREILEIIEGKTQREMEKTLTEKAKSPESLCRPQSKERVVSRNKTRIELVVSDEVYALLQKVRNVMSHRCPGAGYPEMVEVMAREYLRHHDPTEKAERAEKRAAKNKQSESGTKGVAPWSEPKVIDGSPKEAKQTPAQIPSNADFNTGRTEVVSLRNQKPQFPPKPEPKPTVQPRTRFIPTSIKNVVWKRDQGQCTYRNATTGRRCESQYFLELDHIQPFSLRGPSTVENLRLLCRSHNVWAAIRSGVLQKAEREAPRTQ